MGELLMLGFGCYSYKTRNGNSDEKEGGAGDVKLLLPSCCHKEGKGQSADKRAVKTAALCLMAGLYHLLFICC